MKKQKLAVLGIISALGLIIYSCSNSSSSNNSSPTSVAQDKQNITNTFTDFYSCLNTLDDGDLSNFILYSLFNSGSSQYNGTWLKTLSNQFESQYGHIVMNNQLQFANRAGEYTWNTTNSTWTKVANSSLIKLKFPSKSSIVTLDSELTLDTYSDISTSFNNTTYWLPSSVHGSLKRSGNEIFNVSISNITFDTSTNFSMPTNATVTIFTSPYTHTIQWQRNTPTDFKLTYASSTSLGCSTSLEANIKLYDSDYGNITSVKDDVKSINGNFVEGNLKVVYSINVQGLAAYSNPTPAQVNANSSADVYYNNQKIGNLTYDKINNQAEIFITYTDGTTDNVNVYVGDFETKVRAIFANYLN